MQVKKRWFIVFVFVFLFFLSYATATYLPYQIDNVTLQQDLTEWVYKEQAALKSIEILRTTQVDHTSSHVVLFELKSGEIAFAHMMQGWNGKFKIVESGWGPAITYRDIQTKSGGYGVIYGDNSDLEIDSIRADSLEVSFGFSADVSNELYVIKYEKLPASIQTAFPMELRLYDNNDREIDIAN
ncbi:hypothetical protein AY633_04315 [Planococcus maritimus]|nr:hypothetical protein AY633_04315 [Planococcus maritimus]